MNAARRERLDQLARLSRRAGPAGDRLVRRHAGEIEAYRQQISLGIDEALAELGREVAEISGGNAACEQLLADTAEYVSWMKWALWDLPILALASRPQPEALRAAVTACGLVYLSIRIFDDVIDRHFWYKGRHETLLAGAGAIAGNGDRGSELAVLAGLLVCFEGLAHLERAERPLLGRVVQAIRRTVIGAIMERSRPEAWDKAYYRQLVRLKNVDYWRALYAALDPEQASPLYPFLEGYYELAQHLNDVQDFDEDLQQGQPNLLSLYLPAGGRPACPPIGATAEVAPPEVELLLADEFLALGKLAAELPDPERAIAFLKLSESLAAGYRLGLFAEPAGDGPTPAAEPRLYWHSDAQSVIAQVGSQALEHVACEICGATERVSMFEKQGFAYHRCQACSHIYVSPRIRACVQDQMREELDALSLEDIYLEVQRFHAGWICDLLRARAPGPRLLDIGAGRGYLMQLAQAYGFEVYGLDSSLAQVQRLEPLFGRRMAHVVAGEQPIPWEDLQVVVMSHVLEHLPRPGEVLAEVRAALAPAGLLYVAVPDMASMHFKLFGKRWDVVNPLVHFQYFNEGSLARLLGACGFASCERIHYPSPPDGYLPRWARLMRRFGGSESSEVLMLAQVK
ncbi:MAG: methyltransferase domain-containing protein [Candidatus Promineifilaceae bacterium]